MLSSDAAMVIGLATTALPFADSAEAEVERWLRVLRLYGEAGRALTSVGVGEAPISQMPAPQAPSARPAESAVDRVTAGAARRSGERGAASAGTVDVLLAVMETYGDACERVLTAYGTGRDELIERLASGVAA